MDLIDIGPRRRLGQIGNGRADWYTTVLQSSRAIELEEDCRFRYAVIAERTRAAGGSDLMRPSVPRQLLAQAVKLLCLCESSGVRICSAKNISKWAGDRRG